MLTEGLLIYLAADEVGALAEDVARPQNFRYWLIDLASPGLLKMVQEMIGKKLSAAGAPLQFAPGDGPNFFRRFGWKLKDVQSIQNVQRG